MEGKENNQQEANELTNMQMIEKLKGSEELNTLIKNSNEAHWKQNIGGELKAVYTPFDNSVENHLGLKKPDDVKSSEWLDRHMKDYADTKKELETLKNAKGEASEAQEKLWNDKYNKLKTTLAQKEEELNSVKTNSFKNNVSNQLDNYLAGKTFKPTYSDDDVKTLVEAKKAKIITNTRKLENGKTAVYNPAEDKFYTDPLGELLTPTQVAELEFSTMFHTAKTGGNTPTEQATGKIEGEILTVDMNKIKSKGDFYQLFAKLIAPKGLASHSDEYLKIQRATMAHYKINDLPL